MIRSNIGKIIDDQGLKRKYLASKMEVSQNQFSNWVTGRSYPPMEKAFKLAQLLGCKVDDLYEYKEELE